MDKKILIIIIVVVSLIVISYSFLSNENDDNLNKTNTNNSSNITFLNSSNNKTSSDSKSSSSNGLKYSKEYGVYYDPDDPDTWYDSNGNWQKMESDLTKDFIDSNSKEDDVFLDKDGNKISKKEYLDAM